MAQTTVKRVYGPAAQKFANAIWAGDTLYVAGQMASPQTPADKAKGTPAVYGDTEAQTESALKNIETILKAQGLTLADVVQMDVFLAPDPAKDNKMDFAGMNAAYSKCFRDGRPAEQAGAVGDAGCGAGDTVGAG